jgi:hypothetical protein
MLYLSQKKLLTVARERKKERRKFTNIKEFRTDGNFTINHSLTCGITYFYGMEWMVALGLVEGKEKPCGRVYL